MTGPEAFVAIICGFLLGLIALNFAGAHGLIAITAAVAGCAMLSTVMEARKGATRRRATRKMWRR